jgi:DNA ligase-1
MKRRRNPKAEVRKVGGKFCVFVDGVDTGKWASTQLKAVEIAARFGKSSPALATAPVPAPTPAPRRTAAARPRPAPVEVERPPAPTPAPARGRRGVVGAFPGEVMLAKPHKEAVNYTGWWMSEKLDGMRAYWTGSGLFSRNGKPVHAPRWFTDALPQMALDGELMTGRGQFNETISIVRKQTPVDAEWRRIKFHVFDAPMQPGTCEERWQDMEHAVHGIPFVQVVEQMRCSSPQHLMEVRAKIAELGGEGVMLRAAKSAYEHRRTDKLLKVKSFQDTEAKIIGYLPGEGKHEGRLGAYVAQLLTGPRVTFGVGTGMTDAERERPLPKGTIITVKFFELTPDGVPRFPSFVGVRDYE